MALFDFFKKRKEKERFEKKRRKKETAERPPVLEKEKKGKKSAKKELAVKEKIVDSDAAFRALASPHKTEKTVRDADNSIVFKMRPKANKILIREAIEELYGVKVRKVNITKVSPKKRFVRGKHGLKPGYKKAVVYLKKGEKIEM